MAGKEEEALLFDNLEIVGFGDDTEFISAQESEKKDKTDDDDKEKKRTKTTAEEDADVFFEQEFSVDSEEKIESTEKKPNEEDSEDSKEKKNETPSDQNSSSSFLQVLAKSLYEEGVFSSFDENTKIEKATDFIEMVNNEIVSNVEAYKAELPEEIKTLIDVYEEGVPLNELLNIRSKKIEYGKIDPEKLAGDDDVMKKLISDDLKNRGYDDEEIKEKITDLFALDKQEVEAKKALLNLKKKQVAEEQALVTVTKKAQDDAVKERDNNVINLKNTIEKSTEFAGITLTKQHKKEIFDNLMKGVDYKGRVVNAITKAQLENPVDFQTKLATAFTLTKGFTDFTSFGKISTSKTMSQLEEQARRAAEKIKPGKSVQTEMEGSDNEPGSFLKNIRL